MLMLMLVMVSCQQDDEQVGKGFLELTSVGVEGVTVESVSRADDGETFVVEILQGDELVQQFETGTTNHRIAIDAGSYTIKIHSLNYGESYHNKLRDDSSYYGEPQYYKEDEFEIEPGKGVYRSYSLPLINSLVTFKMFDGYEEIFPTAYLTIDDRMLYDGQSAYVNAGAERYTVTAKNTDGEINSNSETLILEPGKAYTITFNLSE
jgi:hypothetical protein